MNHFRPTLFSLLICSFLVACGGSDPVGPDNGGGPGDTGTTRVIKANPAFGADIVEIFVRRGCTAAGCHGGGAGGMTLSSTAATSYASLVGVESPTSSQIRVIIGDAANSYLVKKLENRQGAGNGVQMPRNAPALDNIDLTNIKNWINTGAPNN